MKKLLLILFLICSTLVNAQQHMKFMGIPMGTHINTFKQALANKGFKKEILSSTPNDYIFCGSTFYNREATIGIHTTPRTKKVYEVFVVLNSFSYLGHLHEKEQIQAFNASKSFYNDLANSLSKKYKKKENFSTDTFEPDEGRKGDIWYAPYGSIALELYSSSYEYRISIAYLDSSTSRLNNKEAESDL